MHCVNPSMNGSYIADVNRRLPADWCLGFLACILAALTISSFADALISEVDCLKLETGDNVSNCVLYLDAPLNTLEFVKSIVLREPGRILPAEIRSKAVTNVTLSLPACEALWALTEHECTFRASTKWPSPGLQAGHAYLSYQRLRIAIPVAQRVNFTCPPADWDALLASRGPTVPGLAPCGTAIVSSGQQLVEAIQRLQPGHARVLVTLAANISLPTESTPQRLTVAPDDTQPLMIIYRNVTLAGTVALLSDVQGIGTQLEGGVELDLRMRRNTFDLVTARQQPRPDKLGERPVLTAVDLRLVNVPPGPPATWPLGLLSVFHSYINMDRSGSGGLQAIGLRTMLVYTMGEIGYQAYWYSSMVSLVAEARAQAAWLRQVTDPIQLLPAADGGYVAWGRVGDYLWAYNSTVSPQPLRTASSSADFDLWSLEGQPASPLPPASFAVALNATQLLTLMQEAWTSGPRVILVVANITLGPAEWPQSGARLSYNLTLAGPVAGAPVWLDTRGMALVGPAAAVGSRVVTLRLLRLRLVGLPPPLLTASHRDVIDAAARGAFTGPRELEAWRDRCLEQPATDLRFQLQKCVLELSEASLEVLRRYAKPSLCTTSTQPAAAVTSTRSSSPSVSSAVTAVCEVLIGDGAMRLARPLAALLDLSVAGEVKTDKADILAFVSATVGGVHLNDTTAVAVGEMESRLVDSTACSVEALLLAAGSSLAASTSPIGGSGSRSPVIIGGAVGGAAAALLLASAATLFLVRRKANQSLYSCKLPPAAEGIAGGGLLEVSVRDSDIRSDSDVREQREVFGQLEVRPVAGGQEGQPGKCSTAARAEDGGAGMTSEVDFTFSCEDAKETMAEAICLGPGGPTAIVKAAPAAAAQGGGARGDAGTAAGRRRSEETVAAGPGADPWSASGTGSGARQRTDLRSSVRAEIESNMRKCLAVMAAASSTSNGGSRNEPKSRLLGKGAYGVVYKDFWRGLPAAVKVVVLGPADAGRRRERLTREAGLTLTLYHPHVVPTYHYHIDLLHATDERGLLLGALDGRMGPQEPGGPGPPGLSGPHAGNAGWAQPHPDGGSEADSEGADDLATCVRLRLVMQYCEGGTLGAALARGRFGTPLPTPLPRLPPALAMPVGRCSEEATRRSDAGAGADAAAACMRGPPVGEPAAGHDGPGTSRTPRAAVSAAEPYTGAEGAWPAVPPRLTWQDMRPASNLLLSLLAARDVAAALEYLHAANVVHGDLTENNVLLKAVVPHVPTSIQPSQSPAQLSVRKDGEPLEGCGGAELGRRPEAADKVAHLGEAHATQAMRELALDVDGVVDSAGGCRPAAHNAREGPGTLAINMCAAQDKGGLAVAAPEPSNTVSDTEQIGNFSYGLQCSVTRTEGSSGSLVTRLLGCQPPAGLQTGVKVPSVTIDVKDADKAHIRAGAKISVEGPNPALGAAGLARRSGQQAELVSGTSNDKTTSRLSIDSNRPSELDRQQQPTAVLSGTLSTAASPDPSPYASDSLSMRTALQLCSWSFKISDFGLSVQMLEPSQTHISNMKQGTPFFAAPEVVESGRLSPAADVYSFGVLLWLLLHGVSFNQIRHLLPPSVHAPIAPLLLRYTCGLSVGAVALLRSCLARDPAQRPTASQLRSAVEGLLQDAAGPELWLLLQRLERREHALSPTQGS